MQPEDTKKFPGQGLIFLCLNIDITRQFEFIQTQWVNFGNDLKQGSDRDPIIGNVRDFNYDIVKLLQGPKARDMRRFISNTKCRCTFECAMYASLAFNPMQYPRILAGLRTKNKDTDERSSPQSAAKRYRPGVQPC